MKKTLFLTPFIFCFPGFIQSVNAAHGIRIGLNHSSITGNKVNSDKWKWGYQVGIFQDLMFSGKWGMQFEAAYSAKGGIYKQFVTEQNGPNIVGEMEDVFHFQYFEVPVLLKCRPLFAHNNAFGLLAGIHVSYLIDAYDKQNAAENLGVQKMKFDIRPATNKMDYGLIVGVKYDFTLFSAPLFWDIRYNVGLRALSKESDSNAGHHSLFSSSLGVRF